MKKICNIASSIIVAALLILVAFLIMSKPLFGIEIKAVATGSMEPDLPVGSLIVIKPTSYEDIEVGDDITFSRNDSSVPVTHRVIYKSDTAKEFITQGIANNTADSPISYENVKGKVVFQIPFLGYIILYINTFSGKLFCIGLILVLLVVSILTGRKSTKPESKDNKS